MVLRQSSKAGCRAKRGSAETRRLFFFFFAADISDFKIGSWNELDSQSPHDCAVRSELASAVEPARFVPIGRLRSQDN